MEGSSLAREFQPKLIEAEHVSGNGELCCRALCLPCCQGTLQLDTKANRALNGVAGVARRHIPLFKCCTSLENDKLEPLRAGPGQASRQRSAAGRAERPLIR